MIYVTHDQIEAMTLADRIVVLRAGRVEQIGSPVELYQRPANQFVAGFIGSPRMNFIPAGALLPAAAKKLGVAGNGVKAGAAGKGRKNADLGARGAVIGVRPEHLATCTASTALLSARLELVENLGEYLLAHLETDGGDEVIVKMDSLPKQQSGQRIHLGAKSANLHLFDQKTGARLNGR